MKTTATLSIIASLIAPLTPALAGPDGARTAPAATLLYLDQQGWEQASGEAKADLARWHAAPTDYLLDPNGAVARLYDARATPNMVVIDRDGRVAYMGAVDDTPSTRLADVKTAKNYVVAALDEIAAGKPVTVAATRAYGCSIKYRGA